VLYVVDQGNLDCHKKFSKDAQNTYLKTYLPGESFGELALLYNAPRAATITSKDNSICFSLDRACFNHIVKDAAMKKRERFDEFLQKVNILDSLDKYERGKICDSLQTVTYKKGDLVIKEGDSGNTFFFIQSGKAEALKRSSSGSENVVYSYEANDYFGELSLLRDEPRAASIRATDDLVCAWIDRLSFKRLLGNLDTILERNAERYAKFMKERGILN
jgi:cAMP-dependent protein kinase regulator